MSDPCEYGCGQEAKYILKNGKKCCSKSYNSCPIARKNNSEKNKGRTLNNEQRKKISKSLKGRKLSEETRKKISESMLGKKHSFETRKKLSDMRKGKRTGDKNPFYGKHHSSESKIKISMSNKGRKPWNYMKKGKEMPGWKGGYKAPLYDTYEPQLSLTDKCRKNKEDKNILEVKCSVCKTFFIPSINSVTNRIAAIKGVQGGEHKFYCSEECKQSCSVYKKRLYQNGHPKTKIYSQEEYQQFREYVLERDDFKCQYCGQKAEHVHHERPQKLEPFFALDPDLAWSVCKNCHYEKGHKDECSTGNISRIIC
jgi:5-methylcytosine-specific restriction endonuclease McrA